MTTTTIQTLDDLLDVLTSCPGCLAGDDETPHTCLDAGLPRARRQSGCDWTDLPTFGGEAPRDTAGIWSWDATRLLVGDDARSLGIVERHEGCAYCGEMIPASLAAEVPPVADDEAWTRLAAEHWPGCEWIATRAHHRTDD